MTKGVKNFVNHMIRNYGYDSYHDLGRGEKCEFAAHLISACPSNSEHEFITESPHLDQIIGKFKNAMISYDFDDFVETLKENTVAYFDDTMHAIFDAIYGEYYAEQECGSSDHYTQEQFSYEHRRGI